MVLRQDPRTGEWRDVELAGPNPTSEPPVPPGFMYHLNAISNRLGRPHRPYWMKKEGCFGIQARFEGGEWRTIFMAYDPMTAHKGNEHPYMPLDTRVIDELAEACLEIKYNTGDTEKDRQMDEYDRAARAGREEEADEEKRVGEIAGKITAGLANGDPTDNIRAARLLRHLDSEGGKFVQYHGTGHTTRAKDQVTE